MRHHISLSVALLACAGSLVEPARASPYGAPEALSEEFFSLVILEDDLLKTHNLQRRTELTHIAEARREGDHKRALALFHAYFMEKLREPHRYGLDSIFAFYGHWPSPFPLNYKASEIIERADRLVNEGTLQLRSGLITIGPPGQVNWNHPFPADEPTPLDRSPDQMVPDMNFLVHAYVLTRNRHYLETWVAYMEDWAERSTYARDMHPCIVTSLWPNPLLSTLITLGAVAKYDPPANPALKPEALARILNALVRYHALPIITYMRSNTHNWSPNMATYMQAALVLDEFKAAPFLFREGRRRGVEDLAVTQFLRDGGENQQDLWYNYGDFYPLIAAWRVMDDRETVPLWNERPWIVPLRSQPDWKREAQRSVAERIHFLLRIRTPHDQWPIPLRHDTRSAGMVPPDNRYLWAPSVFDMPENRALLDTLADVPHAQPPQVVAERFPYYGLAIARTGWGKEEGYGALFCSPQPGAYGANRSRRNNNFFGLNAYGQDLLVNNTHRSGDARLGPITVDGLEQDFHVGVYRVPSPAGHKTHQVSAWTEPGPWRWHASDAFHVMEGIYAGPYAEDGGAPTLRTEPFGSDTSPYTGRKYTDDGFVPNARGHRLLAASVLRRAGLDEHAITASVERWLDRPDTIQVGNSIRSDHSDRRLNMSLSLTGREGEWLSSAGLVRSEGFALSGFLHGTINAELNRLLQPEGRFASVDAVFEAGVNREAEQHAKDAAWRVLRERMAEARRENYPRVDGLPPRPTNDVSAPPLSLRAGQTIALLGDTLVNLADQPYGWGHLLAEALSHEGQSTTVIHAGERGADTAALREVFTSEVAPKRPDWVILHAGHSDAFLAQKESDTNAFAQFRAGMEQLLDRIQADRIPIALTALTPRDEPDDAARNLLEQRVLEANVWLRAEAERRGLPFIDFHAAIREGRKDGGLKHERVEFRINNRTIIRDTAHQRIAIHARGAGCWIVVDRLLSKQPRTYTQRWYLPLAPGAIHTFAMKDLHLDPEQRRLHTDAKTAIVEGHPRPKANLELFHFTHADLDYTLSTNFTVKPFAPNRVHGWGTAELATTLEGTGQDVIVTLLHPTPPGAGLEARLQQVREWSGPNGQSGFLARTADGKTFGLLTARTRAESLKLGPILATAELLIVSQRRVVLLGCQDLKIGGQSVSIPGPDFELDLDVYARNPNAPSAAFTPIHRPILPVSIEPERALFIGEQPITLSSQTPDVEIRYTLDGSDPTPLSTRYAGPFSLTHDTEVRARAYRPGVAENPIHTSGTHVSPISYALFTRVEPAKPSNASISGTGLRYRYREGNWQRLWLDPTSIEPQATGVSARLFDLNVIPTDNPPLQTNAAAPRAKYFLIDYDGYLRVPETGVYTFHAPREYIYPDIEAGYELVIHVNGQEWFPATRHHDFGHWSIALEKGLHRFSLRYIDYRTTAPWRLNFRGLNEYIWSGETPDLRLSGPGLEKQPIPAAWLVH